MRNRTIHRNLLLPVLLLAAALLASCGRGPETEAASGGPIRVVSTIGQIGDLAARIGGEHVSVHALMGAGSDPHLYVATEGDVEVLQNADIILYNGNYLEAQMVNIFQELGKRKPVVAVTEALDPGQLLAWTAYEQYHDPHVWFSVPLWQEVAKVIRDTLVEIDPVHSEDYRANAEALVAEMQELHEYVQAQVERVPEEQRILVTAHDAFHYFGRTYDFEVRGLQGLSTQTEAGTGDVQALADYIVEKQIRAIFIESSVPVRNVEALQEAVASKGFQVEVGGELFSDAMGAAGTPEGTYIGMVRHNIDTIVGALLGE